MIITKINEIIKKFLTSKETSGKDRNQVTNSLPLLSSPPLSPLLHFNVNNSDKYTTFKITSATLLARARPRITHSSRVSLLEKEKSQTGVMHADELKRGRGLEPVEMFVGRKRRHGDIILV